MKIESARNMYADRLNFLQEQKLTLTKKLNDYNYDKVEISKELEIINKEYDESQKIMESIMEKETAIHNAAVAKQQGDALAEAGEEMAKLMEIYRRIASGAAVPPLDQKKLLEFSSDLYTSAILEATFAKMNDKKYESLWEEETTEEQGPSASEIAANSEIDVPMIKGDEESSAAGTSSEDESQSMS